MNGVEVLVSCGHFCLHGQLQSSYEYFQVTFALYKSALIKCADMYLLILSLPSIFNLFMKNQTQIM